MGCWRHMATWIWVITGPGLVACRHQAIIWTDVDFPIVRFCGIQHRQISQYVPKLLFFIMILHIILLKLQPHLPGASELMRYRRSFTESSVVVFFTCFAQNTESYNMPSHGNCNQWIRYVQTETANNKNKFCNNWGQYRISNGEIGWHKYIEIACQSSGPNDA